MALDKYHALLRLGRETSPFASKFFCLFFERFPETRPPFHHFPPRLIIKAQMHMWGQIMPKRDMLEFPTRILDESLVLLASVDDHVFVVLGVYVSGD